MLFLSKITILHMFDRFGDHKTKKKKIWHTRPHKLQPNSFGEITFYIVLVYFATGGKKSLFYFKV